MKTFWSCLPVLFAMVVGHLCSPVVRAGEIVKIVKRETGLTSGISVTTYADGHVLTITPGVATTPDIGDTFWGVPIATIERDSVGAYEQSQNAILDKARVYNERVMRHNEIMSRNNSRNNGYAGHAGRAPRVGLTHITIKGK